VDTRLVVEAIKDMQSLEDTCRLALEGAQTAPSATQLQVSETLRHMGLSVEDEVRCPRSGYSIDMLVHDSALEIGGERSSRGGSWAVEFDGPSHFLASGAPTGATLLKRRHLQLLGHTLVSVPYLEWCECRGAGEREQYLRGKLEAKPRHERVIQQAEFVSEQHHQHMSSKGKSDVTAHAHARVEAHVSQDEEVATGKKRRKKKAKNDRGMGPGVFQVVGEVEDQDQQARSNENEERLPSGSPMGEGDTHTHTHASEPEDQDQQARSNGGGGG
jgi:hypothetical protein